MSDETPGREALAKFIGELNNIDGLQPAVAEILQRLHNEENLKAGPLVEALKTTLHVEVGGNGEDTND